MNIYKKYLDKVITESVEESKEIKKDYPSNVYDNLAKFEDAVDDNKDLYDIFDNINNVLDDGVYQNIQNMTPSLNVNKGFVRVYGVTKDDSPGNEELLKLFVKNLQKYTNSKLKFKAKIDKVELDGLDKYQLDLTALRK